MLEENTPDNSYDENGNPIEYINQKYKWNTGRNLESITNVQSDGTEKEYLSFTYDEKGIRTSKKYGSVTYNYTSKDGNITSQYQATKNINPKEPTSIYLYDSNDNIIGMTYRNNPYFFIKNHMGDVIGMVTQDGTWVRSYYYDAWGNDIGTTVNTDLNVNESAAATVNPFRYRGYYYDEQSKMYYLQSRYYRPDTFRFLNADLPEFAKAQKDVYAGINLFAYCCNDPVNNSDFTGCGGTIYTFFYYDKNSDKNLNVQATDSAYYYYYNRNVQARSIGNVNTLAKQWIAMKNPYRVYLFLHGSVGKLTFKQGSATAKKVYQLCNFVHVSSSVYLFSCEGGAGSGDNNMANVFAKLSETCVYALPVGVSYGYKNGYYAKVRAALYFSKLPNTYWHKYTASYKNGKWKYYDTNLKRKYILW